MNRIIVFVVALRVGRDDFFIATQFDGFPFLLCHETEVDRAVSVCRRYNVGEDAELFIERAERAAVRVHGDVVWFFGEAELAEGQSCAMIKVFVGKEEVYLFVFSACPLFFAVVCAVACAATAVDNEHIAFIGFDLDASGVAAVDW